MNDKVKSVKVVFVVGKSNSVLAPTVTPVTCLITLKENKLQMRQYSSLKSNNSCDVTEEAFFSFFSFQIFRQQGS